MRRLCTYFDIGYLARGLALYRSLEAQGEPFMLYILCFDAATRSILDDLALPHAVLIDADELERFDPELRAVQSSRTRVEYYWTSTPCLPRFLFARDRIDDVAYVDADLYFFSSCEPIFRELRDASVLIVEHAFSEGLVHKEVGRFNVGSVTFRNDARGRAVLDDWRARCLEWCYARFEPGRFGDQVYLDEWPARFGDAVKIAPRGGIGLGPWNEKRRLSDADGNGPVVVVDGGRVEPIVYYHFHALKLLSPVVARVAGYRLSAAAKRGLYAPYLRALASAYAEIDEVHAADDGKRPGLSGFSLKDLVGGLARRDLIALVGERLLSLR